MHLLCCIYIILSIIIIKPLRLYFFSPFSPLNPPKYFDVVSISNLFLVSLVNSQMNHKIWKAILHRGTFEPNGTTVSNTQIRPLFQVRRRWTWLGVHFCSPSLCAEPWARALCSPAGEARAPQWAGRALGPEQSPDAWLRGYNLFNGGTRQSAAGLLDLCWWTPSSREDTAERLISPRIYVFYFIIVEGRY